MNQKTQTSAEYFSASDFEMPVTAWQGLRGDGPRADRYLISGTSRTHGLLYVGPLQGSGKCYQVDYPGATTTSVYGPDELGGGRLRLVGSYTKQGSSAHNHGFVWEGTLDDLPSGGSWQTIDYPGANMQFTHSTMGGLAVGNADGPDQVGGRTLPYGPGTAYLYDVASATFLTEISYPGSKSNTAYGIWHNGGTRYTICGGYSPGAPGGTARQALNQFRGFLVDYDSATKLFSNWTSFDAPTGPGGVDFVTHFEGISSVEPGVYTLSADAATAGSTHLAQGFWVRVIRKPDGSFDEGTWIDLNYPGATHALTSSNSVHGDAVVGIVIGPEPCAFEARVRPVLEA